MNADEYTCKELKQILTVLKDKTTGTKRELVLRVQNYSEEQISNAISTMLNESNNSEETVERLKGDVAMLNATVTTLVEKLELFISGTQGQQPLPLAGIQTTQSAASEMLPMHGVVPSNAATQARPMSTQLTTAAGATSYVLQPVTATHAFADANAVTGRPATHWPVNSEFVSSLGPTVTTSSYSAPLFSVPSNRQTMGENGNLNPVPQNNMDVRDIAKMMPEYYPDRGITSIMFIERIYKMMTAYGWSEQSVLYAIYGQLKGPAKTWINAMPIFNCWSDFVQAFMRDFPSAVNSAKLNMQMMHTRMQRNETYVDYFYKMLTLGRSGDLDDAAIITYIIHGLWDETTKKILTAMYFAQCSDLLKALTNLSVNTRRGVTPTQQVQTNVLPKYHGVSEGPKPPIKQGVVCYNCHERGHIARNCSTKPITRKPQHRSTINTVNANDEQCNNDEATAANDESAVNNILPTQKRKELQKRILIMGKQMVACVALIDSGSGKSLVKKSVATRIGNTEQPCNEKLIGFGGGVIHCQKKIKAVLKIDNTSFLAEMLVIDDEFMKHEIIVGIDVLAEVTVLIEKGECRIMPIRMEALETNDKLTQEAECELRQTLTEFSHCFGEELHELGKSKHFKMQIKLTTDKPVIRKPYPIPIPKQQVVEKILKELLTLGIVRPSHSAYSSPILLVKKANGEDRLCVDYRELNSITEVQPWHMPTVDGVIATLAHKRFYTTLDMMSGYYQLELDESSKPLTAFVTHKGQFEFCRMPFGLRNAPSAFQRMMTELIAPLGKSVASYVDEVIIATESEHSNIAILKKFLMLVEKEGLTLRLSKCSFLKSSITFLGHEIDETGVKPGERKISAIKEFPEPTSQHEVRRFLGLAGYFRKFIPGFALIARPLNKLLKKDVTFKWSEESKKAFTELKQFLSEQPVLAIYDIEKQQQLHTDASSIGLAGILMQKEGETLKPLAYFSRACTAAESKYHAYELEALAVVESCRRFRAYLVGKRFTLVTDCSAISSVKLQKQLIPRVARWFMFLLEYDYDVVHRPGTSMKHVDALSRAPIKTEYADTRNIEVIMEISVHDWVLSLQLEDSKIKMIVEVLSNRQKSEQYKQIQSQYLLQNNRLFRRVEGGKHLLVVPKGIRWRVARMCHDEVGHPGIEGTLKRMHENFWFPRMRNFLKGYIRSCIECCYHRESGKSQAELHGMEVPRLPFQLLHMDHLGPFIRSRRGNEFVLVIVDALSRYTIITAVKSTKTKPVLEALNQMTSYFGLPQTLVTDRGTAFTSAQFESYCKEHAIKHIKVAVRTPRANGLAERINQSVIKHLKTNTDNPKDWDLELRMLQWCLNTRVNSTTQKAPIQLVYDFPLRDLSGNKLLMALQEDENVEMTNKRREAIENIEAARVKWKQRFDAKHSKPVAYEVGDLVLMRSPPVPTGESKKLQPQFKGPFQISKVLRFNRYIIEDVVGIKRSQRHYSSVASSDNLKPWCSLFPEADDDYEDEEADLVD